MGMNSAPQMPPQEPTEEKAPPTVEELQRQMEELKAKVAAAQVEKAKDIDQKVVDRESLIGEVKSNDELLEQAKTTLDYFVSAEESGVGDASKTKELRTLVGSLEQKRDEMLSKIYTISSNPDVLGKLEDEAKKENLERNKATEAKELEKQKEIDNKEKITQAVEEFKKDVESLKEMIRQMEDLSKLKYNAIKAENDVRLEFQSLIGEKSELKAPYGDSKQVIEALTRMKENLGIFARKEKKAIDTMFSKVSVFDDEIKAVKETRESYEKAHDAFSSLTQKVSRPVLENDWGGPTFEDLGKKLGIDFVQQVGELNPNNYNR